MRVILRSALPVLVLALLLALLLAIPGCECTQSPEAADKFAEEYIQEEIHFGEYQGPAPSQSAGTESPGERAPGETAQASQEAAQQSTTSSSEEGGPNPVETPGLGTYSFRWVDQSGADQGPMGTMIFGDDGTVLVKETGTTGRYELIPEGNTVNLEIYITGISEIDGKPQSTIMHCQLVKKQTFAGWVESETVTSSGSGGDATITRKPMEKLEWGCIGTQVSTEGLSEGEPVGSSD